MSESTPSLLASVETGAESLVRDSAPALQDGDSTLVNCGAETGPESWKFRSEEGDMPSCGGQSSLLFAKGVVLEANSA